MCKSRRVCIVYRKCDAIGVSCWKRRARVGERGGIYFTLTLIVRGGRGLYIRFILTADFFMFIQQALPFLIYLLQTYLSIMLFIYSHTCPFYHLSTHIYVHTYVYLTICLLLYISIMSFVCPSNHLSIVIHIHHVICMSI